MKEYGEPLFTHGDLNDHLRNSKKEIKDKIYANEENYILNVGESQFIDYMVSQYEKEQLQVYTNDGEVEEREEVVPAEYFQNPALIGLRGGGDVRASVYYYSIPYSGDSYLLRMRPSKFLLVTLYARIGSNKLTTKLISFDGNIDSVNNEIMSFNQRLEEYIQNVNNDLAPYNNSLRNYIGQIFHQRKQEILEKRDKQEKLIVPIKRSSEDSGSYTAPTPNLKKKIEPKPIVPSDKQYETYPTLANGDYLDILKNINGTGKALERKPSVYAEKDEETLRDHFLMNLEPVFEGSATGETFNQKGKTDILLRHDGNNIFISECKFWKGEKSLLLTIDQLLSYLTWRDSKTAIIMFVRNNDFSSIVNKAKEAMNKHSCFLKEETQKDETWFNYTFHMEGDKNKEIKVALLLYHMKPK
ncbi:hypothetical protein ERJ70_01795 [Sediminibacillus dalangtanensis]|uniref:Restriction endonuclease n=1 Tax=Sediminibacillus dalangtanensis TaxID=2729421 RepID=A0ABX7VMU4_9BACI|nr:hypothetical protein [Sediminibacillus dalangtanensis]QTM98152.1 hypothetical protein ERJ70_01795 [Sediminibacillus dalangtanensis]